MTKPEILIRKATQKDYDHVWGIIKQVIAAGDTYVFSPDSSNEKMLYYWYGMDRYTYVARLDDAVVGTFFLKANQADLGLHVANAS